MTNKEQRPWRASAKAVDADTLSPDSTASGPPSQDPEAAELPPGVRPLARILEELADTLPGLKAALDRQADCRPEPLVYRKPDAARLCGMSARTWERLLSAGKAPRPDAYAGKCPLWKKSTLEAWISRGGSK
jgi:hypothetical protein